jgi:hypothetical protein
MPYLQLDVNNRYSTDDKKRLAARLCDTSTPKIRDATYLEPSSFSDERPALAISDT